MMLPTPSSLRQGSPPPFLPLLPLFPARRRGNGTNGEHCRWPGFSASPHAEGGGRRAEAGASCTSPRCGYAITDAPGGTSTPLRLRSRLLRPTAKARRRCSFLSSLSSLLVGEVIALTTSTVGRQDRLHLLTSRAEGGGGASCSSPWFGYAITDVPAGTQVRFRSRLHRPSAKAPRRRSSPPHSLACLLRPWRASYQRPAPCGAHLVGIYSCGAQNAEARRAHPLR